MAGWNHALSKPHVATEQIIALYREGRTSYEIATALGVSQPTVIHRLKQAGVKRRTRWEQFAKLSKDAVLALYESGMNGCQIARIAGVTPAAIRNVVRSAGIQIRPHKGTPRIGPDNHAWKGGRFKRDDGYVWVSVIGEKRNVPEHRLIIERHLGRQLTKDEIVHHLNGVRDDNRLENLVVTTRKHHEHYTYVKALQRRIRELEQRLTQKTTSEPSPGRIPSDT